LYRLSRSGEVTKSVPYWPIFCGFRRHPHEARKVVRYAYRGPVALLDDFFREVERILHERGVS
jgi:hypothetical protein